MSEDNYSQTMKAVYSAEANTLNSAPMQHPSRLYDLRVASPEEAQKCNELYDTNRFNLEEVRKAIHQEEENKSRSDLSDWLGWER